LSVLTFGLTFDSSPFDPQQNQFWGTYSREQEFSRPNKFLFGGIKLGSRVMAGLALGKKIRDKGKFFF